ncbi:MAG: NADPH:quinone oxidoreductase family protein [Comamonadaceae bacterium]|nr:MAG: NADPH:quinone oxidoreductase family protein [Comamonadaceae bacterium]
MTQSYDALVCEQYGSWRDLVIRAVDRPTLLPGQVRIKIAHAGVGFAVSLFVAGTYQRRPPLPFTPGTECAGTVLETASDVTHVKAGDRVVAALDWGAFAQEAVATAETVYPVPDGLALSQAVALPISYATAWSALTWRAGLTAGDTMLVHGAAGGLGMAAVQIGKLFGATVIATASTPDKRAQALARGATHALSSDPQTLAAEVKAITGGQGVDVVFDPVGGALFDASLRAVAPEARILVIGFASGQIPSAAANILLVKNVSVIGFNYGYYIGWGLKDVRKQYAPRVQALVADVLAAAAQGRLGEVPTQPYPFSQWTQAIEAVMTRRSVGKVVLDI